MLHGMRISFLCSIFVAAVIPALAQNLVTNGDFNANTSSWVITTQGTFTHSSLLDADDSAPASGSGQLENVSPSEWGGAYAFQCITSGISGGNDYDWGAKIRFDSNNDQAGNGRAKVLAKFFPTPNCTGAFDGGTTPSVLSSDTNQWIQNQVLGFTAPASAASVRVELFTSKFDDPGDITANFDNVVFGPAGILPPEGLIFFNGFETGDPDGWDLVAP